VQEAHKFKAVTQTVPTGIRRANVAWNKFAPIPSPGTVVIGGPINLPTNPFPVQRPVAVLDTGIDGTHPDLNVVFTVNFSFEPDNPFDVDGHGTHVSGTIGARNNSFGVVGVNPGVPLWAVKVLDSFGEGDDETVLAGMEFVAQNALKVNVVNMSLGGPFS